MYLILVYLKIGILYVAIMLIEKPVPRSAQTNLFPLDHVHFDCETLTEWVLSDVFEVSGVRTVEIWYLDALSCSFLMGFKGKEGL